MIDQLRAYLQNLELGTLAVTEYAVSRLDGDQCRVTVERTGDSRWCGSCVEFLSGDSGVVEVTDIDDLIDRFGLDGSEDWKTLVVGSEEYDEIFGKGIG